MKLLHTIHSADLRTFNWCLKRKHRLLIIQLSRIISRSADGPPYFAAICVFILLGNWPLIYLMLIGFALERIIYFFLKNKLKRNRPQQAIPGFTSVIQPSDQFSFPSGHTSAAFLTMGLITGFYPFLTLSLLVWAIWVGISRVMLGVHFPTDIVAGALLGYSISQFCIDIL